MLTKHDYERHGMGQAPYGIRTRFVVYAGNQILVYASKRQEAFDFARTIVGVKTAVVDRAKPTGTGWTWL